MGDFGHECAGSPLPQFRSGKQASTIFSQPLLLPAAGFRRCRGLGGRGRSRRPRGALPAKCIDAARKEKLLGAQIPIEFGGDGATLSEVANMCYALGRACGSAGMVFATHQTKVACLVRHSAGSGWHEDLMHRGGSKLGTRV
jgi:alkylation response protein AidB-like acyl-CoA dehydrogenase